MPQYSYKAKHGPTKIVEGVLEADNLDSAIIKVMRLGYTPLDVKEAALKRNQIFSADVKPSFGFSKKVKHTEINLFTRQLCDLVEAEVPLLKSLNLILNQTQNLNFKNIVDQIQNFVKDGGTLSEGLAKHPDIFPPLYVNMIRSGEMSGNLAIVLNRLAEFSDKDLETRNKINSSLAYPLFILLVGIGTIFVLLTFVIPRLSVIFEDLGESLPLPTLILVNLSGFCARFGVFIIIALLAVFFYLREIFRSPKGRLWLDNLKLKIPILQQFIIQVEVGRFARTLGTLLESGVMIVPALNLVRDVLGNEILKQDVKKVAGRVANGDSLSVALKESQYIPEMALNMVAVGEQTGRLEQGFYKLADSYERQAEQSTRILTSLIGPMALVLIVLAVGFLVMAMLLPLFKMNLIIK